MASQAIINDLEIAKKTRTYILSISPKEAKKILKSLIDKGEELLFGQYKKYDPSISDFKMVSVDILDNQTAQEKVVFYTKHAFVENGRSIVSINFRVWDKNNLAYKKMSYSEGSFSMNACATNEVERAILKYVSENDISVFGDNKYRMWKNSCIGKLEGIGYGKEDFRRASGENTLGDFDINLIKRFEREIDSLKTVLEIISTSKSTSLMYIKGSQWVTKNLKLVLAWGGSILGVALMGIFSPWLQEKISKSISFVLSIL